MLEILRRDLIALLPASLTAAGWLAAQRCTVQTLAEHNFNLVLPWVASDYLVALDGQNRGEPT